jgi:hypothetical protein
MGGLFGGGGTISTSEPRIGALNVQTSAYGMVIPLVWGRQRIPANMMWYGDFTSVAHTTTQSSGGKGGGVSQSSTTYTYTTAVAMGLCEGPIVDIGSVWKDKTQLTTQTKPATNITVNNEPNTVPASPYQISVVYASNFVSDAGVMGAYGNPFTNVSPATPSATGQYKVAGGTYTFFSGDAGTGIQISYVYNQPTQVISPLSQLNFSLFQGTSSQAAWGYLTSKHPTEAIGYQNTAYVASGSYDLGDSAAMSNHSFEVLGPLQYGAGILDCNPKDVVLDYLTNARYGVGFNVAQLGDYTQFSNYCVSAGLFYSPAFTDQTAASSGLTDLLESVNCAPVFSEGKLKIIPYGDQAMSGNGATYTPSVTPLYDLTDNDFQGMGEDPIQVSRTRQADAFNQVQVEFLNRLNQYNIQIAEAKDQADVELNGLRPSTVFSYHMFCDPNVAQLVAQLKLQRLLNIRNSYRFKLGWNYCLLEPMDIVTLTDSGLGLNRFAVRITDIEEDSDGLLTVTAEEFQAGVATAALYSFQSSEGYGDGQNILPGSVSAPLLFEPPLAVTNGDSQLWAAVSGGSTWGGCNVWVSLDGQSYQRVGQINGSARYGTLNATLGAPSADPDITNTMVALLNADGQLLSGTQADVLAFTTLCYVGGELVAYRDATLQAVRQYGLTYLKRGLYGTATSSHSSGTSFARLDQAIFKYSFPSNLVSKNLYLKFTSFNMYGKEEQNLAEVSAYSYTVIGGLPAGPANLALQAPFTGTEFTAQWSPAAGASSYNVQIWSQGIQRRAFITTITSFLYTLEMATNDGGPWRDWTLKVQTVSGSQVSGFSQLNITNPVPAAPTGITTSSTTTSVTINWAANTETDLQDYQVWLSTTNGFTPGAGTLKYTGTALTTTITGLTTATTYYLCVAARDKWGAGTLNYSSQITRATL